MLQNPQAQTETGPLQQQHCQGAANTRVASHGRFAFPGAGRTSAGRTSDRAGAVTSRELYASRVACLVLTPIQERKNNPQNPLQGFFQPHMPKEAKKSRIKHIQGLKVMRATVMQRIYI